jgi:hypothetical protein
MTRRSSRGAVVTIDPKKLSVIKESIRIFSEQYNRGKRTPLNAAEKEYVKQLLPNANPEFLKFVITVAERIYIRHDDLKGGSKEIVEYVGETHTPKKRTYYDILGVVIIFIIFLAQLISMYDSLRRELITINPDIQYYSYTEMAKELYEVLYVDKMKLINMIAMYVKRPEIVKAINDMCLLPAANAVQNVQTPWDAVLAAAHVISTGVKYLVPGSTAATDDTQCVLDTRNRVEEAQLARIRHIINGVPSMMYVGGIIGTYITAKVGRFIGRIGWRKTKSLKPSSRVMELED